SYISHVDFYFKILERDVADWVRLGQCPAIKCDRIRNMTNIIKLQVKPNYIKAYKKKYPLIRKDAIVNPEVLRTEGDLVHLVDTNQKFLAKGYYGKQNKGLGWVLSLDKREKIDDAFFRNKIVTAMKKRQSFYEDEETNAFRVFNGEGDGIGGLTIDYFDGYYLIQWYSEGIYTFNDKIIRVLDERGTYKAIYEKKRFDTKGQYVEDDDFVKGERGE